MVYKWCIVPLCTNTTLKKPDKLFVSVPTKPEKRKLWLQLAHRDPKSILSHTNVFMCEDHFNMEKDTINYMKYKMGFSQKILLANEAVPTKFHCQKDRRISDISTSLQEYANIQPGVTVKKEEDIRPMPVVLVRCALAIPDTLESADCVRVKTEPLWDLSASCVPETARPIERAVKLERVSDDDDEATWDASEPQTAGLIDRAVKLERVSDDDEATWDAIEPQTAGLVEHVMKIKGWDDGDNASWDVEGFCDPEAQAGHIDHVVKAEGSESEGHEALWDPYSYKVKKELKNAQGGLIEHDMKAEGSESEGNEPLWGLYNNHEVKKELVLGPEEFQRPKVTLVCQGGGILSNLTCSVRLEQMRVDMKSHTCSIGRHTYKFRQCFLSYEDYCTEEGSTSNKLDRQTQHINDPDHSGTKSSRNPLIHQKTLLEKPYKCAYCSYATIDKINLRKHEKTHSREKQYIASQEIDLWAHKTIHTDKNIYQCARCSFTTLYKYHLKIHERTHTGDKTPFKCTHCTFTTAYKQSLKKHENTHSGVKPYKCNYCSHTCTQRSKLKQHEMIHTGEKPYK